jgi:Arc/MetJ-type ribon-helix-helix transcriptional regulator
MLARMMATRSISVSLEEALLADLDAHSANRSAAVSEAISLWLRHRRLAALQQAYADLSRLQGGDLNQAHSDAMEMGAAALGELNG